MEQQQRAPAAAIAVASTARPTSCPFLRLPATLRGLRGVPAGNTALSETGGAFFDANPLTRTVDDLFGKADLGHAGDAQTVSLLGHFGLPG